MNLVIVIGRLTKDPEVRYSNTGIAIASFTVAVDRPVRQGEEKKADFPRVTVFGKQAENCEKYLTKGRKVAVEGRIQTGSYQDKDGRTVYTTDVVANRVEFLEWGDRQQNHAGGYSGGYQTQRPPEMTPCIAEIDRQIAAERQVEMPPQFEQLNEEVPF
jgi:single-strand DNA-binding protein